MNGQDRSARVYICHTKKFQSLEDYQKAIEYLEKHLKTAIENGDLSKAGRAYGNLGNAFQSLSD